MTTSQLCLFIVALLPFSMTFLAKARKGYDNRARATWRSSKAGAPRTRTVGSACAVHGRAGGGMAQQRERASRRPAGDGVRRDPCRLYADVPAELGVAAFARVVRRDGVRGGVVLRCAVSGACGRPALLAGRAARAAAVVGCGRNDRRDRRCFRFRVGFRFAAQERDQRIEQPVPCRRVAAQHEAPRRGAFEAGPQRHEAPAAQLGSRSAARAERDARAADRRADDLAETAVADDLRLEVARQAELRGPVAPVDLGAVLVHLLKQPGAARSRRHTDAGRGCIPGTPFPAAGCRRRPAAGARARARSPDRRRCAKSGSSSSTTASAACRDEATKFREAAGEPHRRNGALADTVSRCAVPRISAQASVSRDSIADSRQQACAGRRELMPPAPCCVRAAVRRAIPRARESGD